MNGKKSKDMKRILSLLLVTAFCLTVAACSKPSVTPPEGPDSSGPSAEPSWDTTAETEITTTNTGMEESTISSDTPATTVNPTTRRPVKTTTAGGGNQSSTTVSSTAGTIPPDPTAPTEAPRPSYAPVVEDPAGLPYAADIPSSITVDINSHARISLWKTTGHIPYYDSSTAAQIPTLTPYLSSRNTTGGCVIICPGGGYGSIAYEYEGVDIAKYFMARGISAFVLKYRVAPYDYHAALSDVMRAIRYVRYYAGDYGIDPEKIAIMGFSAGGHLACMAAEHFDYGKEMGDAIDKTSSRPNAAVLCYPVVSMYSKYTHGGSKYNFLGAEASDRELAKRFSGELGVRPDTPPMYVFHCRPDSAVPVENSTMLAEALETAGIPHLLDIYENGDHGCGLASGISGTREWPKVMLGWLQGLGF